MIRSRRAILSVAALVAAVGIAAAIPKRPAPPATNQVVPTNPTSAPSAEASAPAAPSVAPSASAREANEGPPARCTKEPALEARVIALPANQTELLRLAQEKPEALGSASIGSPTRGSLFGGVEMRDAEGVRHEGGYGWGTELVVRSIERAVREVRRCFPQDTPRLIVGDIGRERGGWLRPHRSHQSGLDADIGYFYRTPAMWYLRATAQNLDVARTWALVRALIEGGNVEMIFMDFSVQSLVKAYLATLPEDERPPADLFESPTKRDTIIRHTWGHATHFHVRFLDPAAVALGLRLKELVPRVQKPRSPRSPRPPSPPKGRRLKKPLKLN